MWIPALRFASLPLAVLAMSLPACDGASPVSPSATGGTTSSSGGARTGGSALTPTGGNRATGGSAGSGGAAATGGATRTGGTATGGRPATGGASTGGQATGGAQRSGGSVGTGGATGGATSTGGAMGRDAGATPDTLPPADATAPDTSPPDTTAPKPDTGGTAPLTIWIAGDSTVATHNAASGTSVESWGWGGQFASLFSDKVTVTNSSVGGRSIQTWLYDVGSTMGGNGECTLNSNTVQTRWTNMLEGMKTGDYLFIQFGINDGDTKCPRHVGTSLYKTLLGEMAKAAKDRGAIPIFLTAVNGLNSCNWTSNRGFLSETKSAGTQFGAAVIDLNALSIAYYKSIACTAATALFADGRTHYTQAGALAIAKLIAGDIKTQKLPLAGYLR